MTQSIFEIAQEALRTARKHIDTIQNDLEAAQALNNRLEERLKFYEEHFGTYEDVQAQALAPSPDAFDFTPSDIEELSAQDAQELTASYQLQLEAEQHASQEDTYKPFKY
jgi:predicted  nucleic acid-binding Zn-ribbon protein